jgi:hypothetical protein
LIGDQGRGVIKDEEGKFLRVPGSKNVTISYSSAVVLGIVEGAIERTEEPGSGHEAAAAIPGVDDIEILPPRRLNARQGRADEHDAMVVSRERERKEFPGSLPGLGESLVKSLGGACWLPCESSAVNPSVPLVGYVCRRSSR